MGLLGSSMPDVAAAQLEGKAMDAAGQQAVRDELAAVSGSTAFARVPALARLLTFLVEEELAARGDLLRETYIGSEFFKRPPDYDPKIDAVVRVSASRLRTRLDEYYADTGSPLRIILRKGSYVPSFEGQPPSSGSAAPESVRPESTQPGPIQPLSDSPPVPQPLQGVTLRLR